jgi:hypothetical protein
MPNRDAKRGERAVQVIFFLVYAFLIVFGFFSDRTESYLLRATRLFWTLGLPFAPFFMVVFGYYTWRRLCPLSLFAKWAKNVPRTKQRRVGPFFERWSYMVIFTAMFFCLGLRLLFINGSGIWLSIFLILIAASAFVTGVVYTGKTWCNFFCPVGLIEKIYLEPTGMGKGPAAENSQCQKCTACKKNCPDIDVEMGYWKERDLLARRLATYGWPGLVFAFYFAYWTYAGTWEYYFSGEWTREPDEWRQILGPGFFFAPRVPKLIASYLSLLAPTLLSAGVFLGLERLLIKRFGRERGIHYCLSVAAFAAFNIFYIFAGAPTWRQIPGGIKIISFISVSLSTWFLVRRLPRREDEAVQERFAKRFIARWSWDEKPPADLREAFYVIKRKEKEKETGLRVYGDTVRELMSEGIVTRAELRVLEQVRAQFNISEADHEKVLQQLSITDRRLFDPNVAVSAEERLQEKGYRIALRNLLVRGATKRDVEDLRRDYNISQDVHQRIVAEMTGVAGGAEKQAQDLLTRIGDLRAVHRVLHSFLIGPSFEFLSLVLLKRQDRLVDHVLDVLSMAGMGEVIRQHRGQLFDQDKVSRRAAIEALRNAGDPGLMKQLIPVLEERVPPPDPKLAIREVDQDRVLEALARDPDPFLRAGAVLASATTSEQVSPEGLERILAGLTDEDPLVREAALQAVPTSWGGSLQAVNSLLVDADPGVRVAAQAALARRSQPGAYSAMTPTDRTLTEQLPELLVGVDRLASRLSEMSSLASFSSAGAGSGGSYGFAPGDTVVTGRFAIPRLPTNLGPVTTSLERMLFLHCVPLFVDFEPEDLLILARSSEERTVPDGTCLFQQGELGDEIFILVSGRVQISLLTPAGPEVVTVLGPGDCMGEMSVIDGSTRSASATVHGGQARLLTIAGDTFRRFLEERHHVAARIIGLLATRLRQIVGRAYAGKAIPQRLTGR